MAESYVDEVITTYNLCKVIDELTTTIADTIVDLMGVYERHYGKNSPNTYFVLKGLKVVIDYHKIMKSFMARTDVHDNIKTAVVDIVLTKTYNSGTKWLIDHNKAIPSAD